MNSLLFINRVYPPTPGATGEMLAGLARGLVQRGIQVTVLCVADHASDEMIDGVRIVRISGGISRKNLLARALGYLGMIPRLLVTALRLPRADCVVTLTDPPLIAVTGPIIGWLKRSRTVHWAQDIYPEVAEELGVFAKSGIPATILRGVSTAALIRHDRVVTIGVCMRDRMLARGIPTEKIDIVPNWTDPAIVRPVSSEKNTFRAEHDLVGFLVMYSGNMGLAHDFDTILDAAGQLQNDRITFVFVGSGPRRDEVERTCSERTLRNVRFLPSQPFERLGESLSAADAHVISMRRELSGLVVPSKFYGAAAAGRPCIFVGPETSEAAREIIANEIGEVVPNEEGTRLAAAIRRFASDPQLSSDTGARARAYGERSTVENAVASFERMLRQI